MLGLLRFRCWAVVFPNVSGPANLCRNVSDLARLPVLLQKSNPEGGSAELQIDPKFNWVGGAGFVGLPAWHRGQAAGRSVGPE